MRDRTADEERFRQAMIDGFERRLEKRKFEYRDKYGRFPDAQYAVRHRRFFARYLAAFEAAARRREHLTFREWATPEILAEYREDAAPFDGEFGTLDYDEVGT